MTRAIPDDAAVIVPAARLIADAGEFAQRSGPTGVLWPNDRNVSGAGAVSRPACAGRPGVSEFQGRPRLFAGAHPARATSFPRRAARDRTGLARSVSVSASRGLRRVRGHEASRRRGLQRRDQALQCSYQPGNDGTLAAFRRRLGRNSYKVTPPGTIDAVND